MRRSAIGDGLGEIYWGVEHVHGFHLPVAQAGVTAIAPVGAAKLRRVEFATLPVADHSVLNAIQVVARI